MTIDAQNNIYSIGQFDETADFNPGNEVFDVESNGHFDAFVQKLDPDGNFLCLRQTGGAEADFGYIIDVDNSGNVFSCGLYNGTVDFDPGDGTAELTAPFTFKN